LKRVDHACLIILSNIDHNLGISKDAIMDIFLEMEDKKTQEAQLVKYFDLLDAYMMSVHEHLFGTVEFLERFEWYRDIFEKIHRGEYLPFLQKILLTHQQN
jgi:5'-deoxynucleotidase YfbR-like HD superfamily hydrolase